MHFRERILKAVEHEEPDRVPVMGLILDSATTNRILGKTPVNLLELLQTPGARDALIARLGSPEHQLEMHTGNARDLLESAVRLGFDANWLIYCPMTLHEDPQAASGWAWHDPYGRLWELRADAAGNATTDYSRGLCPTEAQWDAWAAEAGPRLERLVEDTRTFHRVLAEEHRDRIYPVGYAAPGIFENAWQPMGLVEFTKHLYQSPEFIRRVVAFHTDLYLRLIDAVMDCGLEVVLGGDDLGHKTGPLVRPSLIEEFFGESYRRVAARVHERGRKLIWHSCGNIYAFLDRFIEWGFDGILTLEPTAGMDLAEVRKRVGHQLALVGNLDVSRLMVRGTRAEIDDAVQQAIRAAAAGGGFLLSTSHSHADVDPERLRWMIEAAHRHGRYPAREA